MSFLQTIKQALAGITNPKEAAQAEGVNVDENVESKLREARTVADSFVEDKVEELRKVADSFLGDQLKSLKAEAWLMVDMLEQRIDKKLDEFEKRLDTRLQKELYWKLVGLRWTLIFVLITTVIGIAYTYLTRS